MRRHDPELLDELIVCYQHRLLRASFCEYTSDGYLLHAMRLDLASDHPPERLQALVNR